MSRARARVHQDTERARDRHNERAPLWLMANDGRSGFRSIAAATATTITALGGQRHSRERARARDKQSVAIRVCVCAQLCASLPHLLGHLARTSERESLARERDKRSLSSVRVIAARVLTLTQMRARRLRARDKSGQWATRARRAQHVELARITQSMRVCPNDCPID